MVAAANLLAREQGSIATLYSRAVFLLGKLGNPFAAVGVSKQAAALLAHYCACSGRAAHNATTAALYGVTPRTISNWHAELRAVFVAPDVRLFDNPIDTPHRTIPKWDPSGGPVGANLHGPKIAIAELVALLERARARRREKRELEAAEKLQRARGVGPELAPAEPRPRRRREGPEPPPEQPVSDADVAAVAEAWNWIGLRNLDGSPSVVVIRPEPEDGSKRKPTPEENTIRARLRSGRPLLELLDAIRGAAADTWLRNGRARCAFAWAMNEWKGALERYAAEGRKLEASSPPQPDPAGKDSCSSMKEVSPIHDLISLATFPISPKPPLSQQEAPAARAAAPQGGTAPAAPSSHNGAARREAPRPPAASSASSQTPSTRRRATNEGEQASHHGKVRSAAAMLAHLEAGGAATVEDEQGRVLLHHRQRLPDRLARTCGGCGLRTVDEDGRCTRCGARKGAPWTTSSE